MSIGKHFHSIADDRLRGALIQMAIDKGREQARGDFFHALLTEGVDEESLVFFAGDAWDAYSRHIEFDYPQFAHTLFLRAYRSAYRAHLLELVNGRHLDVNDLVTAIEAEIGLTSA